MRAPWASSTIPFALLGLVVFMGLPNVVAEAPERITIGGLFPMIWAEEAECAGHLLAAADRINNKTDGYLDHVLPQTRVEIYINDSKCAPKPAVESALWQLTQPVPTQAVLGAGCSGASMQSQLVLQVFEVPQVCYGATNPALANKELYPYFLRTIPSDSLQGLALASMASILGYTRVAILANTDAYGSGVAAAFMEACKTEEIDVPLYLSFEPVDSGAEQDLDSKLMQIKSAGLRIIMLAGQRNDAQEVFRKAHALGLTGADYLWLGVDAWMANPIYDDIDDASERAMLVEATQGAVGLLPDIKGSIYDDYVSNVWNDKYCEQFAGTEMADEDGDCGTVSIICPTAIDAATALLMAFDKVVSDGDDVDDGAKLLAALKAVEFEGVSGMVRFDERGERLGAAYVIRNYHQGDIVSVAKIQGGTRDVTPADWIPLVQWPGDGETVPHDGSCPANDDGVVCSGFGTCTYGLGVCTCYDGYAAEDCSEVSPMPLTNKQKKSAVVVCEADNLYTYTPVSFPANVTFAMQVASDPLSGELSALLAVSTHQGLQNWSTVYDASAAAADGSFESLVISIEKEEDLVPLVVQVHATGFVCPAAFGLTVTDSGAVGTDCRPGTFRHTDGHCEDCQPGSYSDDYEAAQCNPCAPGSYAPEAGMPMCTQCAKGEFLHVAGSVGPCNPCAIGNHQPNVGQATCDPCPEGTFQDAEGMSACRVCAFAQYQDETGTSQCKSCPANTDNFQLGVLTKNNITDLDQFVPKSLDDCLPKVGYFGWPGVPATECPSGGVCCDCKDEPSLQLHERFQQDWTTYCECASGSKFPFPQPHHVRSMMVFTDILACPIADACIGATHELDVGSIASSNLTCYANGTCLSYGTCDEAYTGRLCGECAEGFYALNDKCEACPASNDLQNLYMAILILLIAALMVYAITQGMAWFKCGAIAVIFDFMQLNGTYLGFDLGWPKLIKRGLSLSTVLNFNLNYLSPACMVIQEWYVSWALEMLMPFLVLGGYVALYMIISTLFWMSPRYNERQATQHLSYFVNAACFAVMVGYVYMCSKTFELFHCISFDEGTVYLAAYPSLECYDARWWAFAPLGVAGLLVYVLGIPAAAAVFLHQNRKHLGNPSFKRRYGALYLVYREDMYLWEVYLKLKKCLVLSAVTFFGDSVSCQALLALLVLVASMIISRQLPFRYARNNVLQFYASVVSFLTLFFGMFFYTDRLDTTLEAIIVSLCVAGWVAILGFCTHGIVHEYLSYFAHSMAKRTPWIKRVLLHPAMVWMFNTKVALNPFVHWAWRDVLVDDIFWTSVEDPKAIRQLLPNAASDDCIDDCAKFLHEHGAAQGGWMTDSTMSNAGLPGSHPVGDGGHSPSDSARSKGSNGSSASKRSSMLDVMGLSPVSKARVKGRRATAMMVEQAVYNKKVLDAMAVHGLEAMDDSQLDHFHDFLASPAAGNPKLYEEWAELMKSTGKPAALADCIKSILEFKHMSELKLRLDRYHLEKTEGVKTIKVEVKKEADLENGLPKQDDDSAKGAQKKAQKRNLPVLMLGRDDDGDDDNTA